VLQPTLFEETILSPQISKSSYQYLSTIKYIGSKKKILPYIYNIISQYKDIKTVLDGFSGSCRVSQFLSICNFNITSNDLSTYSYILGSCFLQGKETSKIKNLGADT
jgi:adenine-specific DNA-methyltransferase